MDRYDVYLHNVPKVSDDGKVIPIAPHRTEQFEQLEAAQKLAAEQKDAFERVVLIHQADKPKLVERYIDGEHHVAPPKEDEPEADAEA